LRRVSGVLTETVKVTP